MGGTSHDKPDIHGDTCRTKLKKIFLNHIWVNNGVERKFVNKNNIPQGFVVGWLNTEETTLKRKKAHTGKIWVNDGINSKFVLPNNIPEGYTTGRFYNISNDQFRKAQSERSKGKIFANNGEINTRVYRDKIPEGFVLGKLKKK